MTNRDWQTAEPESHPGGKNPSAPPELSIILPCYNEEKNIGPIHAALTKACQGIRYEILFVDDGSADRTCEAVNLLTLRDPAVKLLRFMANAGHQNALRAGYRAARGEWVLTMDADLQHPPESVPLMLATARHGYDVVQMVRNGSQAGLFKDLFSRAFYKVFNSISDVPIVAQASDFRVVSRYACDVLNALPERKLIVRAILPYLGFRTVSLPYHPSDRLHGQAGFSFRKSLDMGSQALFNFSSFPLKLAMRVGFAISLLAFAYGIYNVAAKFFSDRNVPGYTDVIASTLFLGGLILIYLGILGRYLLVIVDHLKRRPEYLLAEESRTAEAVGPIRPHAADSEADRPVNPRPHGLA